jgi:hypothetical protein
MGEFGPRVFQAALIPNGLKIICNVLRGIYTSPGYRGGGVPEKEVQTGHIPDILNRGHP